MGNQCVHCEVVSEFLWLVFRHKTLNNNLELDITPVLCLKHDDNWDSPKSIISLLDASRSSSGLQIEQRPLVLIPGSAGSKQNQTSAND
jgi:hypothetical protein